MNEHRYAPDRARGDFPRGSAGIGGRSDRFEGALDRALELFDLTACDPRWKLHQRREILRAREQFCRIFFDETAEPDLANYLSKYFLQFAVAARREGVRRATLTKSEGDEPRG